MAITALVEKLSKIQKELNAPKNQFNKFGGYSYRSCEDILTAVKPLLEGASLTISDEICLIGDRYYVKATARFTDGQDLLENIAYAREPMHKKGMDESQITGAASSYARKYALNGLFCIDDVKDADTFDNSSQSKAQTRGRRQVPRADHSSKLGDIGDWVIPFGKKYKGKRINEVPANELTSFRDWLVAQDKISDDGKRLVDIVNQLEAMS